MLEFRLGNRVSFTPECGHEVIGTVVRFDRKSVTVVATDGHNWRVAPSFLRRLEDEHGRGANAPTGPDLLQLTMRKSRGEA